MRIIKRGTIVVCEHCKTRLYIKPRDCYIVRGRENIFSVKCLCCNGVTSYNRTTIPDDFFDKITKVIDLPYSCLPIYDLPITD